MQFKKLLSAIGLLAVSAPVALSVVACGPTQSDKEDKSSLQDKIDNVIKHKDDENKDEFYQAYSDYLAFKVTAYVNADKTIKVKEGEDYPYNLVQQVRNDLANSVTEDEKANEEFPVFGLTFGTKASEVKIDKEKLTFTIPSGELKTDDDKARAEMSNVTFHYEIIKQDDSEKIKELEEQIKKLQEELDASNEKAADLENQVNVLNEQIDGLNKTIEANEATIADLQKDAEANKELIANLQAEIEENKELIDFLANTLMSKNHQLAEEQAKNNELNNQLNDLQNKYDELNQEHNKLLVNIADMLFANELPKTVTYENEIDEYINKIWKQTLENEVFKGQSTKLELTVMNITIKENIAYVQYKITAGTYSLIKEGTITIDFLNIIEDIFRAGFTAQPKLPYPIEFWIDNLKEILQETDGIKFLWADTHDFNDYIKSEFKKTDFQVTKIEVYEPEGAKYVLNFTVIIEENTTIKDCKLVIL